MVIALIGILSAIALPNLLGGLPEKQLKNAARNLYSDMQRARLQAVKENKNITMSFDTGAGTYTSATGETVPLKNYGDVRYGISSKVPTGSCYWNTEDEGACTMPASPEVISVAFSKLGTASRKNIFLKNKNDDVCYAIAVNMFGSVSIKRFSGSSWE